jgi:MFS transporter, OPA family, glycerol-3-phosphate transporter
MEKKTKIWRWRIFAATWLAYFGFYFCRKPFFLAKASLLRERKWSINDLGNLGTTYHVAYASGQFLSGALGQMLGARVLLLAGMSCSIFANLAFGFTNTFTIFAAFMLLNGVAQSTGWSAGVGTMAQWFHRQERGTVMGFWATNYQAGGVVANLVAAWFLGNHGYKSSFYGPCVILGCITVFVFFNHRNRPGDLGLESIVEEEEAKSGTAGDTAKPVEVRRGIGWNAQTVINVLIVGTFYFFVKFIRYTLWSWVPMLLNLSYGTTERNAGNLSTVFDACGPFGVITAGILSDRFFRGRRAMISFIFILAMGASCFLLYTLGQKDLTIFTIALGLIGFTLYGPDALMTGAGAIDVGSPRAAVLSAGIINGMGSIGSIAQELLFKKRLKLDADGHIDPDVVFTYLLLSSALAALCLALLLWRNHRGAADM